MSMFRYEPYNPQCCVVYVEDAAAAFEQQQAPAAAAAAYDTEMFAHSNYDQNNYDAAAYATMTPQAANSPGPVDVPLPACARHRALEGAVTFVHFPAAFDEPVLAAPKEALERLFIGQLPYGVTTQEVSWLVYEVTGRFVAGTECIKRWTGAGAADGGNSNNSPKGCVHTYCMPGDKDAIVAALHRRVLIDDGGVWLAEDAAQKAALEAHCAAMVRDKARRHRDMPYQPVVVQSATSTFVPHERPTAAAMLARRRATPPPPSYDESLQWAQ